jgi:hypothetical protein
VLHLPAVTSVNGRDGRKRIEFHAALLKYSVQVLYICAQN